LGGLAFDGVNASDTSGVVFLSGARLCGFLLVLQASLLDCVPFDPFSFQQDCLTAPEVHVGRG
jgi:hypothetical protein